MHSELHSASARPSKRQVSTSAKTDARKAKTAKRPTREVKAKGKPAATKAPDDKSRGPRTAHGSAALLSTLPPGLATAAKPPAEASSWAGGMLGEFVVATEGALRFLTAPFSKREVPENGSRPDKDGSSTDNFETSVQSLEQRFRGRRLRLPNVWVSILDGETASAEEIYQKLISGKIEPGATVSHSGGALPVVDYFNSLEWLKEDTAYERRRLPIVEAIAKKKVETPVSEADASGKLKLPTGGRIVFVDDSNNFTPLSKRAMSLLLNGAGKDASRILLNLGNKAALFDGHLFRGYSLLEVVTRKPRSVMQTSSLLRQLQLPAIGEPEQRPYSERATEAWSVILKEAITHPSRKRLQLQDGLRLINEVVLTSQMPVDVDRFVTNIIGSASRLSPKRAMLFFLTAVGGLSFLEAFRLGAGFTRRMNHEALIDEALEQSLADEPKVQSSLPLPSEKKDAPLESWLKRYVVRPEESHDLRFVRSPLEALALFHDLILRSPNGDVVTRLSGVDLRRYLPSLQGSSRKALQLLFALVGGKGTVEVLDKNLKWVLPPFTVDQFAGIGFPQEAAFTAHERRYSKNTSKEVLTTLIKAIDESRKISPPQSSYGQDRALARQARKDRFIREWNLGTPLQDLGSSERIPVAIIRGWMVEKYGVEPDPLPTNDSEGS